MALPMTASAHVKWFASYDVTKPPKHLADVITAVFLGVLSLSLFLLFLMFLADGYVARRWPRVESSGSSFEGVQEKVVRLGTGAYFLCIWTLGLYILTPELHTKQTWVFGVQFLIAFCAAWRRTCIISALGVGVLYVYGVTQYGFFHMLDYVYFLGLGIFVASVSLSAERLSRLRIPAMIGCLAFSVMWTAIEKLLYPQWTQQVLEKKPHLAMGMHFGTFIVFAAFIEFSLAFYLATGRGLLRLGALVLLVIFVSAMPEFGARDVVGHIPIAAILSVPFLAGDSALQRFWRLPQRGIVINATATCLLYVVTLAAFVGMYYGVQWIEYRPIAG